MSLIPMPLWWGKINKRLLNQREISNGNRPVLVHRGRVTGRQYQTPLDAHRTQSGFMMILVYGSGADWVKNVLAAGAAELIVNREVIQLVNPRIVNEEAAFSQLVSEVSRPPGLLRIREYLLMDMARE